MGSIIKVELFEADFGGTGRMRNPLIRTARTAVELVNGLTVTCIVKLAPGRILTEVGFSFYLPCAVAAQSILTAAFAGRISGLVITGILRRAGLVGILRNGQSGISRVNTTLIEFFLAGTALIQLGCAGRCLTKSLSSPTCPLAVHVYL